ncbi:hypoxia up-regulated protein, putative [Ixodes scapularis]|uniref:Hypoxia up-regulated protein 1 n=1 Tax=Ixodes scapularis TaxID=6945 RepID=B7QEE0_IXOSC|nr:hypoxia up-regulated protein, putative [Ixodes scapularis]|eukprot:XP_002413904.1 hypoxia up-regulated protein, putative [Ixodes scapularis]
MSVDLGTEWMKVAIVSPGVPMEIALNKDSQRKTPVAIAFREGERHFGDQAISTGVRFPEKSFSHFLDLLGKTRDNPVVKVFERRFPFYTLEADPQTGGVLFRHPEGMTFSPEELLGMILSYAKDLASTAAGQPIKDAVVTVPAYFNQAERRALARAVSLAGLKLLQLLGDNTAVALNYGVFRRKEFNDTPTNILFYDMGTGSTTATIVSYQTVKSKEKGLSETVPQLSVKGIGYDRFLGGLEFKLRLGERFAKDFSAMKKTSKDVFENKRGLAKLYKEADRVKKVLSANTEHVAQVENVMEDVDFKHPITRTEFEELCSDLFSRVAGPIHRVLESSGMTLDEIDQVILVGGSTRIPRVQQELQAALKDKELGKSLNADEAAALGAAYQAAYLSKGFKVKVFHVKEANVFPIQVDFSREVDTDGVKSTKLVRRVLFYRNNLYPQKKVMTFSRYTTDFEFSINYGDLSFMSKEELSHFGSLNISTVSLSGVADALKKHSEGAEPKGIKAHFKLDESGLLTLDSVSATVEEVVPPPTENLASTLSRLGSTLGNLFSSGSEEPPKAGSEGAPKENQESKAEARADGEKTETETEGKSGNKEEPKTDKEGAAATNETVKTLKVVPVKEPINFELKLLDRTPPTSEQIAESIKKLSDLESKDKAKLARDHARNALESFVLETKDKMYSEEYERAASEEEKQNIVAKLNEGSEWLEYESDNAETKAFKDKLSGLTRIVKDLFDRVQEHRERPQALAALTGMLNTSEVYLTAIQALKGEIFTEVEITTLAKAINETRVVEICIYKSERKITLHCSVLASRST